MSKTKITAVLLAGVILGASLLTGCANRINLKESGGRCVSSSGETVYQHAPTCYVPVSLGDERGKLEVSSKQSLTLHEIPHMDADAWLTTEEGDVLYAEDVTLPTLAEMEPTAVLIYRNTAVLAKSAEILDTDTINRLTAACNQGETYTPTAVATYVVRFQSNAYPGLYYSLHYVEEGDSYYLYDRWSGTAYAIDSSIRDALSKVNTTTETAEQ